MSSGEKMPPPIIERVAPDGSGLTADLYRNKSNGSRSASHVRGVAGNKKTTAMVTAIIAMLIGSSAFFVASNVPTAPAVVKNDLSLKVTKQIVICNQWGMAFYQKNGANFGGGPPDSMTSGSLVARHEFKTSNFYFLRAQLVAFNYTNNPAPSSFMGARLEIPLGWYASWASNLTGKDVGYAVNRNLTVSLYEVVGPWKTWFQPPYYTDGATWALVAANTIKMNRNAVSTVTVNDKTFGVGSNTKGNLSFNIDPAIRDWQNGTWNPANGFLIALIAPWEATSQPFMSLGTLKLVQFDLKFPLNDIRFKVALSNPIPEFGSVIIPIVAIVCVVALRRRRGSS